jgi:hypothetical protein
MINKQIPYFFQEYDSRVVANSTVNRAYFATDRGQHQVISQQLRTQLTEMLAWICEHKVLPTDEGSWLHNWCESPLTDPNNPTAKVKTMPCKSRIPRTWVEHITDTAHIFRNPKTGDVRHTRPCVIGVLGGLVNNLATQRELTEPQIESLNIMFACTQHDLFDHIFPDHWIRYEFRHQKTAQRDTQDRLTELFR